MTQMEQLFEEGKQRALKRSAQLFEEEKQQVLKRIAQNFEEEKQQVLKDNTRQIVSLMIKKAYPTEEIISVVPNYSRNDVEALRNEMSQTGETMFSE